MLEVSFTTQFKRDYKLCVKRGYNMLLLQKGAKKPISTISATYMIAQVPPVRQGFFPEFFAYKKGSPHRNRLFLSYSLILM